jgi:hypothetical protein
MNIRHHISRCASQFLLTCGLAGLANPANAQVVIGPERIPKSAPVTARTEPQTTAQPGSLSTIASAFVKSGPLVQWGPIALRPHTTYSLQYGSGFLRVPNEPVNSTRQTFTQGLLVEVGKTWVLDASISRSAYSSRLLKDTYDSDFRISGSWSYQDWTFGLTQVYQSNSPIVVETGGQNAERTTRTTADVSNQLGARTSLQATATWSERLANPELRSASWTGSDWAQLSLSSWFNYHASDKLSLSLGLLVGKDDVKDAPDMTYMQPQIRVRWLPTKKLSMGVGGGVEKRTIKDDAGKDSENPVYNANISYTPTLTTSLSINGSQNVSNSYFNNQTIKDTSWSGNVSQRLLKRFFLGAGLSQGKSEYAATTRLFETDRDDKFRSYNASLSTSIWQRGSISFSYIYSRNYSNTSEFQYASRQFGLDLGYRF